MPWSRHVTAALLTASLLFSGSALYGKTNYKKWLNEEVVWIISKAERKDFKDLKTTAAREEFISQFWRRRDPTPSTEENAYKEEHYRRLVFARKMFQEGIPGWKSDRGRIYILHGPPDAEYFFNSRSQISPTRKLPSTSRSPRTIIWVYHELPTAKFYRGETRLVFQPASGFTRRNFALSDSREAQDRADELARRFFPASDPNWLQGDVRYRLVMAGPPRLINAKGADLPRSGVSEFGRHLEDLFRPPGELLEEERKEIGRREKMRRELHATVGSEVTFGDLPFQIESQPFFRPSREWLVAVEVDFPLQEVGGEKVDVYAALLDVQGAVFDEFVDSIRFDRKDLARAGEKEIHYWNAFSAPSGDYQLRVILRELKSKRTGYRDKPVHLPASSPAKVRLGSIMMTNRVEVLPEKTSATELIEPAQPGNSIVFDRFRLLPNPSGEFSPRDYLFLYLQIWVPAQDREISVSASFIRSGQVIKRLAARMVKTSDGNCAEYGTAIPLGDLEGGEYLLQVQALDHTMRTFDFRRVHFTILEDFPPASE